MKKVLLLVFTALLFSPITVVKEVTAASEPNLQMSVISDLHINRKKPNNKFEQALLDLRDIAPNYDTIAIVGDMTEGGFEEEYQRYSDILKAFKNQSAEEFVTMGNHEYFEPTYDKISSVSDLQLKQRFIKYTGEQLDDIFYDKWIKGYHFISLAGELSLESLAPQSQKQPGLNDAAYLSERQYQWLEKTLSVGADPNKPIFVFLHQPIRDTVYGSMRWHASFDDQTRLLSLLKKYPQVILFSGHSHYLLNHPKSIYQDGFTMVNTSSVEYTWFEGGEVPTLSQGFIVNVYDDRVEFKAREFSNHTWINTTTIPIPFKETVKENNKPFFIGNSNLSISDIRTNSVTLSWDQGQDDTIIDRYVIKESGASQKTLWSHFWTPEERVSTTINELLPDTTYNLDIYALDAWDNSSLKPIKASFKTSTSNGISGWYYHKNNWYYFDKKGIKKTGWLLYNNDWYYLNPSGAMETGWSYVNGKWYYLNKDGSMKSGWLYTGGQWYFFDKSGAMQTGWLKQDGQWYFFTKSGTLQTGWLQQGGQWYFLDKSGAMKTGWLQQGTQWYYLKTDGTMVKSAHTIGGRVHNFYSNGVWKS
jgi:predicted MPP superfamily phosphohydrolase